jgi:hypothetical protein
VRAYVVRHDPGAGFEGGGHIYQVFIGEEDADQSEPYWYNRLLFTGYTLNVAENLSDDEVVARWKATGVVVESEITRGSFYMIGDIPLDYVLPFGATRCLTEPNGYDAREDEYNPVFRIVTHAYERGSSPDGYAPIHSDAEREAWEGEN